MAGETKGAQASRKQVHRPNATDKVYASGDVSALHGSSADSTIRKQPAPALVGRIGDTSTDQYYANNGGKKPAAVKGVPAVKPKTAKAKAKDYYLVSSKDGIAEVVDNVVNDLCGGRNNVKVAIAGRDFSLMKRFRAALDIKVTNEVITEDQARDVQVAYDTAVSPALAEISQTLTTLNAILAPPVPTETKAVLADVTVDPEAFLAGDVENELDKEIDVSAVQDVTIDPDDTAEEAAPLSEPRDTPTVNTDDDDEGDPITPVVPLPPVETVTEPVTEVPAEDATEEAPKEATAKPRSRKGGRN